LTAIGFKAFSQCTSLASVVIPDSVTSIDNFAFTQCTSLASVVIPDSVTLYLDYGPYHAFPSCLGYGLVLANASENYPRGSVTCLPCSGQSLVVIPDSVTVIGEMAFQDSVHQPGVGGHPRLGDRHRRRRLLRVHQPGVSGHRKLGDLHW
jgi:hypothetical protein